MSRTGFVTASLKQRLANALGAPAMNLPVHDHRIYNNSNVIDGGKSREFNNPRFFVDLSLGDAAAVGKTERCRCGVCSDEAIGLAPSGEFAEAYVSISADDEKTPIGEFDICGGRLEPLRRKFAPLFDQTFDGTCNRAPPIISDREP